MNSYTQKSIVTGAILGSLSVALGAFGTHMLRPLLEVHYMEVFETAVRYQMYHAIAFILLGLTIQHKPLPKYIYTLFLIGISIFTLTLYGIVIGSMQANNPLKWLGAITPLGGASLISAWVLFAYHTWKK